MIVFYMERLVPRNAAAVTLLFVVLIRPKYRDDRGLHEHERVHVRQFRRNPLFPILWLTSRAYRLRAEVVAYREQLRWYRDDRTKLFAHFIATRYKLGITAEAAERLLNITPPRREEQWRT